MSESNKRVLSIQSHVVSGYVGNKAAVFPLQLLGFDVDVINSVQFSNHTGYPAGWEGEVLDGSMLEKLVDGMDKNGLLTGDDGDGGSIGNILTGYIGSESFLRAIVNAVLKLKGLNPKCRYICDPVLGDMGRFYVPKELVDIYRRDVLPLADVLTPNQFEVEQLTGITIKSIEDAKRACCALHDFGVTLVLITSIVIPDATSNSKTEEEDGSATAADVPSSDSIAMLASRRLKCSTQSTEETQQQQHDDEQYILYSPKFPGQFTGTGDICAALFLAWTDENNDNPDNTSNGGSHLASALEKLAGAMHAIVQRTANYAAKKEKSSPDKAKIVSSRELRLIQSRDDILNPPRIYSAERVQDK